MNERRAKPWIEPGLYVECPYCGKSHLLDSDHSVYLPDKDETMECDCCAELFIVEGQSDA